MERDPEFKAAYDIWKRNMFAAGTLQARKRAGLTQAEVAKKMELKHQLLPAGDSPFR